MFRMRQTLRFDFQMNSKNNFGDDFTFIVCSKFKSYRISLSHSIRIMHRNSSICCKINKRIKLEIEDGAPVYVSVSDTQFEMV